MNRSRSAIALVVALFSQLASPHGGGLDASGCHTNRKTGEYHCHRGTPAVSPSQAPQPASPKEAATGTSGRSTGLPPSSGARQTSAVPPTPSVVQGLPPGCYVGPRGGTYTIAKSGKKNYGGC